MENQKAHFFEENPGELSMMRLLCFVSLILGVGFAVAAVWLATNVAFALAAQYAMIFAFGFLGSSVFGKSFQKLLELNPGLLDKK